MASGNCVYHIDVDNRLRECESDIELLKKEDAMIKDRLGNPAVTVALISCIGVCVTAVTSFIAVVFAPAIRAWLGVG